METIEKTMALTYHKNIFGFAFYDNDNKSFTITCDTLDTDECDVLKSIVYKLNIKKILVSLELEISKYECLMETTINAIIVDRCTFTRTRGSRLNKLDYKLSSNCLNALVVYLDKNYTEFAGIKDQTFKSDPVHSVNDNFSKLGYIHFYPLYLFMNSKYMYMNIETVQALSLFKFTTHPNINIKTKSEDLSLYKVLNNTSTTVGARLLKQWLSFPLIDKQDIEDRHNKIEYIISSKSTKIITEHLKACINFDINCSYYNSIEAKREFYNFYRFLINSNKLLDIFANDIDQKLNQLLIDIIDTSFELTNNCEFIIKPKVDSDLDELKSTYNNIQKFLDEAAIKCSSELKIELTIVYFPQLGYLIETNNDVPTLEMIFSDNDKKYYKNPFMVLLDREIGDLYNKIKDLEFDVLHQLIEKFNVYSNEIISLKAFVAQVDCYNSLAIAAEKYNMTRPVILDIKSKIYVKGFRNIININRFESYIVNDVFIDGCTVITGPNCSGKSAYINDIGIIVILNQIGSYIPCDKSSLSIFDKLFTKIVSTESLELERSAFMSDVIQCSNIFRLGTCSSLALIDEFGKGTNIPDGCSLFLSAIHNLNHMTAIFVTHFNRYIEESKYKNTKFLWIKNHYIKKGIYNNECENDIIKKVLQKNDEYVKYCSIRKIIDDNKTEDDERDDRWAVKIVNNFIQDASNK